MHIVNDVLKNMTFEFFNFKNQQRINFDILTFLFLMN